MSAGRSAGRQAGRNPLRAAVLGFPCLVTIGFLVSCATVPQRTADTRWIDVLPADATIYLAADVGANRELLKKALEGAGPDLADVAALLSMSRRALIAVFLQPPEPLRYHVVALGSYPSFLIGLRLATNPVWKRIETPRGAFFRNAQNIQASIPSDAVLLASNDGMEGLLERLYQPAGFILPPEVEAAMGSSDMVLYLPQLPGGLGAASGGGTGGALPIHEVWFEAKVNQGAYVISGTVVVESEKNARGVALLLRLALVSWLNTEKVGNLAEKLKSVSVAADGPSVSLSGLVFSEAEVLSLLLSLLQPKSAPEIK